MFRAKGDIVGSTDESRIRYTEAIMGNRVPVMMNENLPAEAVSRFSAVLDREEFRVELENLFVSKWHWGTPDEVRVQPLKAHKNRCTFEIAVKTETGRHNVIGKVHATDRSDVFAAMQAVVQSGFGPGAEFAVPQPLAYLPRMHILLEEKVQGRWAMEIFLNSGPDERIMTAQRCGAWLAQFHNVAPRQGNLAEPDHLLPQTRYWTERIKSSGESFARRSESLSEKLEAAVPNSRTVEFCPGHGSYMPEHVFLNGKRTICFDLDEHDVADPARDLAWFIVSLQRLGLKRLGSLRARDIEVDAFLKSYATARDQNALRHLPFFKAAECLHRAHRDLYKRTPPIPQWAEIMIDEGLSALRVPSH